MLDSFFIPRSCWLLVIAVTTTASAVERCDLLLKNGSVQVGDGSIAKLLDIAIDDGKIVAMEAGLKHVGDVVIDCAGMVVAPGFIDLHTHSDEGLLDKDRRSNNNYLMQGCTTVVTGNCGMGHVDVARYLNQVDRDGAGSNVIHLLPHGSLRTAVMGKDDRDPTEDELKEMVRLAGVAMKDGAFGMATGLIYVPGTFTKTEELIAISKEIANHGGLYVSHIRGEGRTLLESVEEAIQIGSEAGCPTHVSHFKASGKQYWGTLHVAAKIIEDARREGKRVTADQYPYMASSTSLEATLLPQWARSGGRSALKKRLADPADSGKIREEVVQDLRSSGRIQIASCEYRRDWVGKSLDEIAKAELMEVVDVVLAIEANGGASVVNFGMSEEDVRMAMKFPWVATASDGSAKVISSDMPHPRSFGTFPRKIGYYAIQEQTLSLEAAIRSATSLPAEILGLSDRGLLKVGHVADIVVFEPKSFRDQATFQEPYKPPTGIKHVFVGGEFAVFEGIPTGALLGKSIRKKKSP